MQDDWLFSWGKEKPLCDSLQEEHACLRWIGRKWRFHDGHACAASRVHGMDEDPVKVRHGSIYLGCLLQRNQHKVGAEKC